MIPAVNLTKKVKADGIADAILIARCAIEHIMPKLNIIRMEK
jgi:hypothetical protein